MPAPTASYSALYAFGGYEYGNRIKEIDDSPIAKSGIVSAAAYNGGSTGIGVLSERRIDANGVIMADSQEGLRQARDEFLQYHQPGRVQQLIVAGNRWLWAAPEGSLAPYKYQRQRVWKWELQFVCSDPYYYQAITKSQVLARVSDTDNLTTITGTSVGGTAFATPYFTFTVGSIATPGVSSVILSNQSAYLEAGEVNAERFVFFPRTAGNYTVYFGPNPTDTEATNRKFRHQLIDGAGTNAPNKYRRDAGEVTLSPNASNAIHLALSGVSLSAATLNWFSRYI